MSYDPLSVVSDEPLAVTPESVQQLSALLASEKFTQLPGANTAEEQFRLSGVFNELLVRLLKGLGSNPSKLWVMRQFQWSLEAIIMEDTEGKEHFGHHLEKIMDVLQIESSDGLLGFYL